MIRYNVYFENRGVSDTWSKGVSLTRAKAQATVLLLDPTVDAVTIVKVSD